MQQQGQHQQRASTVSTTKHDAQHAFCTQSHCCRFSAGTGPFQTRLWDQQAAHTPRRHAPPTHTHKHPFTLIHSTTHTVHTQHHTHTKLAHPTLTVALQQLHTKPFSLGRDTHNLHLVLAWGRKASHTHNFTLLVRLSLGRSFTHTTSHSLVRLSLGRSLHTTSHSLVRLSWDAVSHTQLTLPCQTQFGTQFHTQLHTPFIGISLGRSFTHNFTLLVRLSLGRSYTHNFTLLVRLLGRSFHTHNFCDPSLGL
jgi:hypothetical protein